MNDYALLLPVFNAVLLVALVAGGIHLRFHGERAWTGIGQSQELQVMKAELAVLRGNYARLERDVSAWRREDLEINRSILQELNAMRLGDAERTSPSLAVEQLLERINDLEQAIAGLPCNQIACPPPGAEKKDA